MSETNTEKWCRLEREMWARQNEEYNELLDEHRKAKQALREEHCLSQEEFDVLWTAANKELKS